MPFTLKDLNKRNHRSVAQKRIRPIVPFTNREEELAYFLRLKTIELRSMLTTLKKVLSEEDYNHFIVEYNLRLKKARTNYEKNNWIRLEGRDE